MDDLKLSNHWVSFGRKCGEVFVFQHFGCMYGRFGITYHHLPFPVPFWSIFFIEVGMMCSNTTTATTQCVCAYSHACISMMYNNFHV